MKKALMIIVAVIVVGGGGYLLLHKNNDDSKKQDGGASQVSSNEPAATSTDSKPDNGQPAAATITYSNDGYSPSTVTVKSGDTVVIKNDSSRDMQFDSDPHPAHTNNQELNVGVVAPGESMSFVVKRTGTFGYHNHLNASDTGTIVVQ